MVLEVQHQAGGDARQDEQIRIRIHIRRLLQLLVCNTSKLPLRHVIYLIPAKWLSLHLSSGFKRLLCLMRFKKPEMKHCVWRSLGGQSRASHQLLLPQPRVD